MANGTELRGRGVLMRLLMAFVLVFVTFNPWGGSYYHWAIAPVFETGGGVGTLGPLKLLAGLVLAVGWVVCIQATRRSLGLWGVLLVAGVMGTLIWLLIDQGLLSPDGSRTLATIVLLVIGVVLAAGMSWSHLSRRLTGQIDTDRVD